MTHGAFVTEYNDILFSRVCNLNTSPIPFSIRATSVDQFATIKFFAVDGIEPEEEKSLSAWFMIHYSSK